MPIVTLLPLLLPLLPQEAVWRIEDPLRREVVGAGLATLGDLDGDHRTDFAVVSYGEHGEWEPVEDRIELFSGAHLALLLDIPLGVDSGYGPSRALADVGDLDGDGRHDVAVGLPGAGAQGEVRLFSSADGRLLFSIAGDQASGGRFGRALEGIGDVDGDGLPDLAVGSRGHLTLLSGRDGRAIAAWSGRPGSVDFGADGRFCRLGDFDGDGRDDLLVADLAPTRPGGPLALLVELLSGRDLALLARDEPTWEGDFRIEPAGDADGDGRLDYALLFEGFAAGGFSAPAPLSVRSLVEGRERLRVLRIGMPGSEVVPVGDLDGDGCSDLAVTSWDEWESTVSSSCQFLSGRTGALLWTRNLGLHGSGRGPWFCLAGPALLDDDGFADVLVGGTDNETFGTSGGLVATLSPHRMATIAAFGGDSLWLGAIAAGVVGDVDGDGVEDVKGVVALLGHRRLTTWSGRDGSVLRSFEPPFGASFDAPVVRVPDRDGDGIDDYAVSRSAESIVEIRSTRTDALLLRLADPRPGIGFGSSIAIGVDATGKADTIAVGAFAAANGSLPFAGEVTSFALADGAPRFTVRGTREENLGLGLCSIGDVDGDGHVDWAIGGPYFSSGGKFLGRVLVASGRDGHTIKQLTGSVSSQRFGASLAASPDLDGDSIGELLIGIPSSIPGSVRVVAGKKWTTLFTLSGPESGQSLGARTLPLPDLDGDSIPELLGCGDVGTLLLFSGRDGRFLHDTHEPSDPRFATRHRPTATPPWAWRPLPKGARPSVFEIDLAEPTTLVRRDYGELFGGVGPETAKRGDLVVATLRGGSPGALCGLYLDERDGFPLDEFLGFGVIGVDGTWSVGDTVPPGLAGTEYALRGYAVAADGRLVETAPFDLWFR